MRDVPRKRVGKGNNSEGKSGGQKMPLFAKKETVKAEPQTFDLQEKLRKQA